MKKTNEGFGHILILVVVIVLAGIAVVAFGAMQNTGPSSSFPESTGFSESAPEMEPVSAEDDTDTIEKELEATVTGDFETDINLIEGAASEL